VADSTVCKGLGGDGIELLLVVTVAFPSLVIESRMNEDAFRSPWFVSE
jgi:hypothetical protein